MAASTGARGVVDSPSLGELLLCDLKNTPTVCPDDREDLTTIKCRGGRETRLAHWSVLRVASPCFAEIFRIRKNRKSVELPVSAATLDLILDYIYTRQRIRLEPHNVIELLAAAQRFLLTALLEQLRSDFIDNLKDIVRSPRFLTTETNNDVHLLSPIFRGLLIETTTKLELIERLNQWSTKGPQRLEIFSKLTGDLLAPVVTTNHEVTLPTLYVCDYESHQGHLREVNSLKEIECRVNFSKVARSESVIRGDRLFAVASTNAALLVFSLSTGDVLQDLPFSQAQGIVQFESTLYAYSRGGNVCLMSQQRNRHVPLTVATSPTRISRMFVIDNSGDRFVFVVKTFESKARILEISTQHGMEDRVREIAEEGSHLIGTWNKHVFALGAGVQSERALFDILDGEIVKQVPIRHEGIRSYFMCEAHIYYVPEDKENKAFTVKVIDTTTYAVLCTPCQSRNRMRLLHAVE